MLWNPVDVGILGAGGFAREVRGLLDCLTGVIGYRPKCFIDKKGDYTLDDLPVFTMDQIRNHIHIRDVVCGIGGTSKLRQKVVNEALEHKLNILTLIHPSVQSGMNVDVGQGTVICAGNIITTNVKIGRLCQINLACTIGHDCVIGDNVVISPGCNISGKTTIMDGAYIGTGAKILENLTIGKDSIVGAGAVVTKNVPDGMVAVGVPAKAVKPRNGD